MAPRHDGCVYAGDPRKVTIFCVRYVKSQLFEITSVNTPVMAGAIGVLVSRRLYCGVDPARRTTSINPVTALRVD